MGTNYASGRNFEYRVRDWLESRGYTVIRSAGSRGFADLVALAPGEVLLVQCTTSEESKSESYRSDFREEAEMCGGIPLLVYKERVRGPLVWDRLDDGPLPWEGE